MKAGAAAKPVTTGVCRPKRPQLRIVSAAKADATGVGPLEKAAAPQTKVAAAQLDDFSLREKFGLGQCSQKAPLLFAALNAA